MTCHARRLWVPPAGLWWMLKTIETGRNPRFFLAKMEIFRRGKTFVLRKWT